MDDLRHTKADHLQGKLKMLTHADMIQRRTVAYAVEWRGAIVTCISVERFPGTNEWVPAAIMLNDQITQDMRVLDMKAVKEADE